MNGRLGFAKASAVAQGEGGQGAAASKFDYDDKKF
jgi:hypothetical protein